jgi:hypothetical protein
MLVSPSSVMGERGLPSWKGSSGVKATRQDLSSSSLEGAALMLWINPDGCPKTISCGHRVASGFQGRGPPDEW